MGHLDGTKIAPSPTDPNYQIWFSQDQLIQQAMMTSVDTTMSQPVVATSSSTKAWALLHATYADKSHTCIFSLRDLLQNTKKAQKAIAE